MATAAPMHTAVQDLLEMLRGVMRFRWAALLVAWCTAIVLWTIVFFIPNSYEATARVYVDTRTTLSEATQGISLGDDIASQIELVREAITGVPQLEKVATQTNLLAGTFTPKEKQAVIDGLQKSVAIEGQSLGGAPGSVGGDGTRSAAPALFTISYRNRDRMKSLQVVTSLLNNFVEGSLGGNHEGSEQAQQFLQAQIAAYGKRLNDAEQRLADFKRHNVGLMPQDQQDYFSRLQSEISGLAAAKESLAVAISKRGEIGQEIKSGQPFVAGSSGGAGAMPATIGQQIEQTQQQLDQLLLKYTDEYPNVIALRHTLEELKARQKVEAAEARKGDAAAAAAIGLAANPVYQQLQEQYNEAQVNVASIQQDIADRQQRIAILRSQMGAAPGVQAQYSQLMRNYDVTKSQYEALLQRLDRARLGQQAAATGIIKFQVIDPPAAKYTPVAPNRPMLIVGALLAAIAAGLGVAYGLNLLRPAFGSTRQLAAVTGLQVLGAVSLAWYDRYRARQRRGRLFYVGWSAALVLFGAGILLLQGYISNVVQELIT